jgi:hypothetical protein
MAFGLCKYKNAFGKLNTGIHSYKIGGVSVLDFGVAAIAAYLLSLLLRTNFLTTLILFLILGIIIHRMFCVRTTVDKWLFPNAI